MKAVATSEFEMHGGGVEIYEVVHRVKDASSLADFVDRLRREPEVSDGVLSANAFLEQLSGFLRDTSQPGGYLDRYRSVQSKGWKLSADLLLSATIYE